VPTIEQAINQKEFKNIVEKLYINILYTSGHLKRKLKDIFTPYDITSTQYNVLRILKGRHPEACHPGQIVAVMVEKMSDVTRLIDRLTIKGLTERNTCPGNRRKINIHITEKGISLLNEIEPVMNNHFQKIQTKFSEQELELICSYLDRLRE